MGIYSTLGGDEIEKQLKLLSTMTLDEVLAMVAKKNSEGDNA